MASKMGKIVSEVAGALASRETLKTFLHSPLYSSSFYLMMSSGITGLIGFVFWILMAKLYSPVDIGLSSALLSATALLTSFSTLGLVAGLIRFVPNAGKKTIHLINSCFTVGGAAALLIGAIFVMGIPVWSPSLLLVHESPWFVVFFVIFVVTSTLSSLLDGVFMAKRSSKYVLIRSVTVGLLKMLVPIVLAGVFGGAFVIFTSVGIATVVTLVVGVFFFLPRIQQGYRPIPLMEKNVMKDTIPYSLKNYLSGAFWSGSQTLLPILVVNILGAEINAYFYVAWSIVSITFVIPSAVSFSLFTEGSYDEKRLASNAIKSLKFCLLLSIPTILVIFGLGDKLLLVFGKAYSDNSFVLLWILSLSLIPFSVNSIWFTVERVRMNMRIVIALSALALGLTAGLSYILMNMFGLLGVGIGWDLGQAIVAIVILASKRRAQSYSL